MISKVEINSSERLYELDFVEKKFELLKNEAALNEQKLREITKIISKKIYLIENWLFKKLEKDFMNTKKDLFLI